MSISHHFSFLRNTSIALLAASITIGFTGCSSDGTTANPNIDLTTSYKVVYVPGSMEPAQGKTQFQIILTNRSDGEAVIEETVQLMAMMYMTDMTHATPIDGNCLENGTAGTYDCTVYYLMADSMDGVSMGYWELKVMIGGMTGESALFYPSVGMAMGGTARTTLKNSSDQIEGMMAPEARTYYLFKSSLSGMNNSHTFQIFIAAKESMMSFPAIETGTVLNEGSDYQFTTNPIEIIVSSSADFSNAVTAAEDGSGYWTATGISGLTNDVQGNIYVKMFINTVQYTLNGDAAIGSDTNDYTNFTVTPSASM